MSLRGSRPARAISCMHGAHTRATRMHMCSWVGLWSAAAGVVDTCGAGYVAHMIDVGDDARQE